MCTQKLEREKQLQYCMQLVIPFDPSKTVTKISAFCSYVCFEVLGIKPRPGIYEACTPSPSYVPRPKFLPHPLPASPLRQGPTMQPWLAWNCQGCLKPIKGHRLSLKACVATPSFQLSSFFTFFYFIQLTFSFILYTNLCFLSVLSSHSLSPTPISILFPIHSSNLLFQMRKSGTRA